MTNHTDICNHQGTERFERVAHGYLGDAPAGTHQTICLDCGSVVVDEEDDWLTENDFRKLRDLLDRLICRQEDREDRRADQLAFTYQMIKDIEEGR